MEVKSLIQLAAGGNLNEVEDLWIARLEEDSATPETAVEMLPVIDELIGRGNTAEAAALAWTTLELLGERFEAVEVVGAAGPLLLKLSDSDELRQQVAELYRRAYADRPGIEALMEEAGIVAGRPVRRALRTLDVCLSVSEGTGLVARHEDATAKVQEVDQETWTIRTITRTGKESEYGPVKFADTFVPVENDDYRVLRDFEPDRLRALLEEDPPGLVISVLRSRGNRMYGDELKDMLCPSVIPPADWSKWWARARTALKRSPHVSIEGRTPYLLKYLPVARTLEQEIQAGFGRLADSAEQYAAVETYLRECASRKTDPDPACLIALGKHLETIARRQAKQGSKLLLGTRLVQRRIDQVLGRSDAEEAVVALLRSADDPIGYVRTLASIPKWEAACTCLALALPERAQALFAELLPLAPLGACDLIAARLAELGHSAQQFEELVQQILTDPVEHSQALFWLWDGPAEGRAGAYQLITVLTRMLSLLAQRRRIDSLNKEQKRLFVTTARSVLAARKYERFKQCLEQIEQPMASALLTQVRRLDNVGRVVLEDLQKLIRSRFPGLVIRTTVEPWADESVLYVTSQGLHGKQREIDELINVKMKENAKRIGEAASHGDLSENSEYKFALEERDLLRARLAQMQEQVAIAEVLEPKDVRTDRVNVGTRVTVRHVETGAGVELAFLGPWDADIERHVYNYKAPFSQAIMGKTVGDTIELTFVEPTGKYEITAIDNGLAGPAGA